MKFKTFIIIFIVLLLIGSSLLGVSIYFNHKKWETQDERTNNKNIANILGIIGIAVAIITFFFLYKFGR